MSDSKALRDAAAILLDQANKMDGKPSTYFGQDLAPILQMWNSMLAQFAAEDAKRVDTSLVRNAYDDGASEAERYAANAWKRFNGDRKEAIAFLSQKGNLMAEKEAAKILRRTKDISEDSGAIYKADLPDEWIPKMLDWDKPLKEQPEVLKALERHPVMGKDSLGWRGAPNGQWERAMASPTRTGEWLYRELADNNPVETAKALQSSGIPGIRYLDGGSRPKNIVDAGLLRLYEAHGWDAKKAVDEFMSHVYESPKEKAKMHAHFMKQLENAPTYNYVVFPGLEDQVKILERNGVPFK